MKRGRFFLAQHLTQVSVDFEGIEHGQLLLQSRVPDTNSQGEQRCVKYGNISQKKANNVTSVMIMY